MGDRGEGGHISGGTPRAPDRKVTRHSEASASDSGSPHAPPPAPGDKGHLGLLMFTWTHASLNSEYMHINSLFRR